MLLWWDIRRVYDGTEITGSVPDTVDGLKLEWLTKPFLISVGKRIFFDVILPVSAHTFMCCWCLITRCGNQEIMVQLGVIKLQLSMSREAPVLASTHWTGTCHQRCADLIFTRSRAHSILSPTNTQPLSKRLSSLREHIILPLVVTLWLTTIRCVFSTGAHLSTVKWKNQFLLLGSYGLFTEPKGVMTHSNGDSVLLGPPHFFFLCVWFAQHPSTQEGATLALIDAILPLLKST